MIRATALVAVLVVMTGCPAPALPAPGEYDVVPWDAMPGTLTRSSAPSCAPESVVDANARGTRTGTRIVLDVDTRTGRNDLHPRCVTSDSTEIVVRYTVPVAALADGGGAVQAIRVTTVTDETRVNGRSGGETGIDLIADPTTFDTVLSLRAACDSSDANCNNDGFVPNASGQSTPTRRSEVWQTGLLPEDSVLIVVDGYNGAAGTARLTLDEFVDIGAPGAPCADIPPERAHDPSAPTAAFRCHGRNTRCQPEATPDGTDLCVPTVALGATCDQAHHFDVCDPALPDVQCAQDPSMQLTVVCALPGTAAGTTCRPASSGMPRCDGALYCSLSGTDRDPDYCVQTRRAGESCDPTPFGAINHCADGYQCCETSPDAGTDTSCIENGHPCVVPPAS